MARAWALGLVAVGVGAATAVGAHAVRRNDGRVACLVLANTVDQIRKFHTIPVEHQAAFLTESGWTGVDVWRFDAHVALREVAEGVVKQYMEDNNHDLASFQKALDSRQPELARAHLVASALRDFDPELAREALTIPDEEAVARIKRLVKLPGGIK